MSDAAINPTTVRRRNSPINDAHVLAFHPGPGRDHQFPRRAVENSAQRLARLESEFLEAALGNALDRGGVERRGQAAIIIALRAEVAAGAAA